MNCAKLKSYLPDLVFDPTSVPASVQHHVRACQDCRKEFHALQADFQSTMNLLDEWKAPEPSPFFNTRMSARLHEARQTSPAGFFERLRARLLFGSNLQLRPAMTAALALAMVVGGGSYAGFVGINNHTARQPATSAAVRDLQILDANDQTIQQLNAFEGDSDSGSSADGTTMSN